MTNTAFSVAFQAPSWNDPDFFALNYFKRVIGEYRCDKYTGEHLNSPHLQYNSFHTYLGNYPDLILHKPFYFVYSDFGLFGNFIYGNEMYTQEMSVITQNTMSVYAQFVCIKWYRSTNPKSSELETSYSTIFSNATNPALSHYATPNKLLILTDWFQEPRLLPDARIWPLNTCQRLPVSGSGTRKLQSLDGVTCILEWQAVTITGLLKEPPLESTRW